MQLFQMYEYKKCQVLSFLFTDKLHNKTIKHKLSGRQGDKLGQTRASMLNVQSFTQFQVNELSGDGCLWCT
jgi:hypothetical protein